MTVSAEKAFWNWFIQHEDELLNFETDQERVFDKLAAQLGKIDSHVCFEFGPREDRREFVIGAGGFRESFPAVVALAKAAPALKRWRVTAFRPRRSSLCAVELGGENVDPANVRFSLLDNGRIAGFILYIPGYREDDVAFRQIGYLMLDEALGEFDVETRLGMIRMLAPEAESSYDRFPLARLPELFDELVNRLEGRAFNLH